MTPVARRMRNLLGDSFGTEGDGVAGNADDDAQNSGDKRRSLDEDFLSSGWRRSSKGNAHSLEKFGLLVR